MVQELPLVFCNCRNIASIEGGSLPLQQNRLNILFGRNGTGKTTISRVLECWNDPKEEEAIEELASFEHMLSNDPDNAPVVNSPSKKTTSFVFNDDWVASHCFHEDGNLQSGAYELYVSSKQVRKLEKERERLLQSLNSALNDGEVVQVRALLDSAGKSIGSTASGNAYKAFKENGPLEGLPSTLRPLVKTLNDSTKPLWMAWHISGKVYAENKRQLCPYCGSHHNLISEITAYDEIHADAQGNAWDKALSVFAKGDIFRFAINRKALRIMSGTKALNQEELNWISDYAKRSKALAKCLVSLREDIVSFHDGTCDGFFDIIKKHLETLEDMRGFSDQVRNAVKPIVNAIKRLIKKEEKVRKVVFDLETEAAVTANKYKDEIDDILEKCGYPYTIEIVNDCH